MMCLKVEASKLQFVVDHFFAVHSSVFPFPSLAMGIRRGTLFAFVFLIKANFLAFAQLNCINNGMNYTTNTSTYRTNLNAALSTLSTTLDSNGFSNASVGQSPDRASAIILCNGDIQLDECRSCLQNATGEVLKGCPNQKQAIIWNGSCMLRYSNETILGTVMDSGGWNYWNTQNATSPEEFEADLRKLMDDLRGRAANGGSLRKVAAGNVTAPDFQYIYGFVQCTPDLSARDCDGCLLGAAEDIPGCCDRKVGAVLLRPSCKLRFEIYPFYNETRLQELEPRAPPGPGPASAPPPPLSRPPPRPPPGKGDGNTTLIVIIAVVSVVGCLILAVLVCFLWRRRIKQKSKENLESRTVEDVDISTVESLQYNLSTIRAATDDFSDSNKLGQGGFGSVYKGKLSSGREIAVKRLSKDSGQGDLEFKNEVLLLARLQHRNLVRLVGFCLEGTEKLLVYEFIQNASLDLFIFDRIKSTHLDWDRRYKILGGIARGILYLHEDSRLRIIHRDLKASNVLLDGDMNPKIADFGMARLFGQDETQGSTSRIVGTYYPGTKIICFIVARKVRRFAADVAFDIKRLEFMQVRACFGSGYMAPEYAMHGQFSIKSDVFSFGVLVLEIISGQRNNCFRSGEIVEDLLSFAWKNWSQGTTANMVDPFLRSGSGSMSDILRCIHIGLLCVQENAADRPTMASVVLMLNSFSITLSVPKEPAFYSASGNDSEVALMEEYNSRDIENRSSSKSYKAAQSDHSCSSNNDASITELYPR